jgi:DMSO/TMAO reductase YedYZ molybdopterin-dependent catalytic subunit
MIMRDYSPLQSNLLVEKLKSMTYVIFCQRKHRALGGKLLEKSLLQISLLAMAIGLISSGSLTRVFCLEVYSSANATTNNDSALRLAADVSANNTLTLSLDDLTAMPQSTENAELYCYGQLVASGYWTGVRLGLLLETAGVDQQAGSVGFHAQDGYSVTLPITEAMRPDVIIAYEKDGQPLDEGLRLVIPGANGNLWISMITNLVVLGADGNLLIGITMNSNSTISTPAISLPSASFPSSVSQPSPAPSQSPTLQSSPTPQPENQSVTSPVVPPSNDQPARQQGSPSSSLPVEYGYLILSAIIVSAAAGYLFYKRRK